MGANKGGAAPSSNGEMVEKPISLPFGRLIQNWQEAHGRAAAYLRALGMSPEEQSIIAARAAERAAEIPFWRATASATCATMRELWKLLAGEELPDDPFSDEAFLAWRVRNPKVGQEAFGQSGSSTLPGVPPITRGSMKANRLVRRGLRLAITRAGQSGEEVGTIGSAERRRPPWRWAALRRRALLTLLVLLPTIIASGFMLDVLPQKGGNWLEVAIAVFFGALFGWIAIGFWTALFGFLVLATGREKFSVTAAAPSQGKALPAGVTTALLMPICDEPVERVFAGLRAIYRSVERTGALDRFHFFVLSDTIDPGRSVEEELAWFDCCRALEGFGRIFYRRRRLRIARKSGNIADFCRRWGTRYRYMITLDADSLMSGETIVRLVELMESHPRTGMIQTAPVAAGRHSLLARIEQFATRLYGPMFAAGLHYWQLGDGQYWGHNAIIRVEPFMKHCSLPRLPGKPPLGGEIFSHDFVEAALMGRAGWEIWLAYDLEGSYEEAPSSLLEEMKRDRRWCQGNLQHLWLLPAKGLHGAHRALFLNGVLSYVSAVLWFTFLTLSTAEAIWEAVREPDYFPAGRSLFPQWPVWRPDWAIALLAVTAAILFLPKLLSTFLVFLKRGRAKAFGGIWRLCLSVVLEIIFSALLAPVRMVFHARFVLLNVLGRTVPWRSQPREDSETTWSDALRHHTVDTLWAGAWGLAVYKLNPDYFWWLIPIIGALILSVPLSTLTSRVRLGELSRRLGLFLVPEETAPAEVLRELTAEARCRARPCLPDGFLRAVVDPRVNAIHCALLAPRRLPTESARRARLHTIEERGLEGGPEALDASDRRALLWDRESMCRLHRRIWEASSQTAQRWGIV